MSDSESTAPMPAPHATTGGKSLASVERPRYKSWRKKYRKMRHKFDGVLEENKRLFKDEQKLEGIAKRLRQELDELLDLLVDINSNPALPPELRFNISLDKPHSAIAAIPTVVPEDVTPETANAMFLEYTEAVSRGQIPHLDLNVIRHQLDKTLTAQGVPAIETLDASTSHGIVPANEREWPEDMRSSNPPGYLTAEEEDAYILRLDAKLGDHISFDRMMKDREKEGPDEKHWAEYTPREIERQIELQNPQSQHNWLKTHAKNGAGLDMDDTESLASHDTKPATGRGGKGKRDLAKQVGDRAVGRAREGFSPSAASAGFDDDELAFVDEHPGAAKKRGKGDVDGTYRVKGGKAGATKGKRKRSGEDVTPTASAKKTKVEPAD